MNKHLEAKFCDTQQSFNNTHNNTHNMRDDPRMQTYADRSIYVITWYERGWYTSKITYRELRFIEFP